jgi:hypothetical protein
VGSSQITISCCYWKELLPLEWRTARMKLTRSRNHSKAKDSKFLLPSLSVQCLSQSFYLHNFSGSQKSAELQRVVVLVIFITIAKYMQQDNTTKKWDWPS